MKKKKYKYMHTLNGSPARYWEGQQICYVFFRGYGKLVDTFDQIKKERRLSLGFRRANGWDDGHHKYGHIKIEV